MIRPPANCSDIVPCGTETDGLDSTSIPGVQGKGTRLQCEKLLSGA